MLLATVLLSAALAPQAPPPETAVPAASPAASPAAAHIDAGVAAFKRRRFTTARAELEKAVEADPSSAAAAYYLGYTYYKMGEPSRRMNANKEKAKQLFARAFTLDPTFAPTWGK
jgi:Tfp pilus assembly protein PilF